MTSIDVIDFALARVPLDQPTSISTRSITERHYLLVRVITTDGAWGIGFCYAGNRAGGLSALAVSELLAPVLLHREPIDIDGAWDAMYGESLLHGRAGSVMRALSALDIALWDLNARLSNQPLWRYLGGNGSQAVPAYASGGYYWKDATPKDVASEMRSYVSAGFRAVKMKIGRIDVGEDAERIGAAREAVGPAVELMLDANNAWKSVAEAVSALDRFAPYQPAWIEEPFGPDDIESHAQLARLTEIPVATGEIEAGRWRHEELLVRGAAAILQTDAAVCGGVSEWRRIATIAEGFGVSMAPHWFHDLHVHLTAATPNATYVEFFPDSAVLNFRRLIDHQLETRDGRLLLPTRAGLGFDFHEQAVAEFAGEGWGRIS